MSGSRHSLTIENMSMPGGLRAPTGFSMVGMLASFGGLQALSTVISALPAALPVPVFVLQHGNPNGDGHRLAHLLGRRARLPVAVAVPGDPIPERGIVVVPAGHQFEIRDHRMYLTAGRGSRGGDALFTTMAAAAGRGAIGVVLTGMQGDGAAGVRAIKTAGGRVLVQDPATAQGPGMPLSALATGCVDHVLPLTHMAPALTALTMTIGAADLLAVPAPAWAMLG
jgi:two-component system chemotaxis response regulator CheB